MSEKLIVSDLAGRQQKWLLWEWGVKKIRDFN